MGRKGKLKQRIKDLKKYYSKEDIFLSRMASILKVPQGVAKNLFRQRSITVIRLNTLKEDEAKIIKSLASIGVRLEKVEWLDSTYIVPNLDKSFLGKTKEYLNGLFYIQNLSSMIPGLILDPSEKDKVLDMCAAPGSKTTQIAQIMNNKGLIIANDADAWRTQKLKEILNMFGVRNTEITNEDGVAFGAREEGRFNKVLLDAPCSGEGMIYLESNAALRFWNIKKIKSMVKVQKELILSAFKAIKKGGTLIYSTCTLEPDENEGVVTQLLNRFANARVVEIPLFNSPKFEKYEHNIKRGITSWNGKEYSPEVSKTYRVIPSSEMMGFYIAKIVKE